MIFRDFIILIMFVAKATCHTILVIIVKIYKIKFFAHIYIAGQTAEPN